MPRATSLTGALPAAPRTTPSVPFRYESAGTHAAPPHEGTAGDEARSGLHAVAALFCFTTLIAVYYVVRAGGLMADVDSGLMALAIRTAATGGRLISSEGTVYDNGYEFTAVSHFLLTMTGIDVAALQQVVYPLVTSLLVFPAWALYRELCGNRHAATLAVLFLFIQPEFLFVTLRGSHERILRVLMLLALWVLVRSFRFRTSARHFATHVALFYLLTFALITTNLLFGVSFIMAVAIAMVTIRLLGEANRSRLGLESGTAARFATVAATSAILAFLFMFYVYPPALQGLYAFTGLGDRLAALFLTSSTGESPYVQVVATWTSPMVYLLLSSATYLLMTGSAAIWLWATVRWLRGRVQNVPTSLTLLWLLYLAFAAQGAMAVAGDRSSLLGGNLQHRAFPSFAMLAAPVVALAVSRWSVVFWRRLLVGGAVAALCLLSLLKATNEPTFSNKWTFYTDPEVLALQWSDRHTSQTMTWVGFDERLVAAFSVSVGSSARDNQLDSYDPKPETRTFLVSDVIRLQGLRLGKALPGSVNENRVYDNGTAQLYRQRPRSPFQS